MCTFIVTIPLGCANEQTTVQASYETSNTSSSSIIYDVNQKFSEVNLGDVPYYYDKRNNALGIDARIIEYRSLFARATREFTESTGTYNVTITTLTEEDGESLYRLIVNNQVVATYRNPYIGPNSKRDLKPHRHTWRDIQLNAGDTIGIESNADTNGQIPEHGGTAWARGRWQQLAFDQKPLLPFPKNSQRPHFDRSKDLLISQFDFQPDIDDVHAVAALGSMMKHSDMDGVNLIAVAGTVGNQGGEYINANSLMKMAFGRENLMWTDAHKNWQMSVNFVHNRVRAVLSQGGRVWVQEAGQSNFTRDWVEALISSGVHESVIKNNVIIVQHSDWNEKQTSPKDLDFVKSKTNYKAISDGNKPKKVFVRKNRRGPFTPIYVEQDSKWIATATSEDNVKKHAKTLWQLADKIVKESRFNATYSSIPNGGVDFSDHVEIWWILNQGQTTVSVHSFWQRYVTNVTLDKVNPPSGRIAIIADGNSPDPDDIGATPVIFGLLKQSGLAERLVHVSHSCDLDPFRNKAKHQIDKSNEARRQKVLHQLAGESVKLFGPFENLRNYYNCRVDQQGATQDLVDAINASTEQDPLWIIEAGEPDLIGYALQQSNKSKHQYLHVVSHHPANDNSGDYFEWQQILDFGVTEHQIGDQNVTLQTPIHHWDWAKEHQHLGFRFIWEMLAYAEQDGIVPFQANKFDCSDAGMVYWWITGANVGGNNFATPADIKKMLVQRQ
ncbi:MULTISPECIES: hypothetical protein [unclassified Psychrosphaera]|uniref:hypothetical protein n=1 Tax=unclassified Psychrosphaera TaxID=2641570 RepID=UPI002090FE0F|nr:MULTISPECIES: hypothetical protein [unclassified Psychrosphaera]